MPRYFFNIHDGRDFRDDEGMELPNFQAARQEAVRYAGRVLTDDAKEIGLHETWTMEVSDARGLVLFRIDFLLNDLFTTAQTSAPHISADTR